MTENTILSFPCAIGSENTEDQSSGLLLFTYELKHLYVLSTCTSNLTDKAPEGTENLSVKIFIKYGQKSTVLKASSVFTWVCSPFAKQLQSIFKPKRDWVLTSNDDESKNNSANHLDDSMMSLSKFVIYKVNDNELIKIDLDKMRSLSHPLLLSDELRTGCKVLTRSYPFGPDILEVFTDVVSCGVISNISTYDELILTDARCLPGSEGGGLYLKNTSTLNLIGIIVSPLCWKSDELVGFTICCSMWAIFASLLEVLKQSHHGDLSDLKDFVNFSCQGICSNLSGRHSEQPPASPTVVRIDVGGIWGSGVIVAARCDEHACDVIIVTCRHVVEKNIVNPGNSIIVSFDGMNMRYKAKIVFATNEDSAYDLAVLSISANRSLLTHLYLKEVKSRNQMRKKLFVVPYAKSVNEYVKGASVHVKGYPLFDTSSMSNKSVSSGVLSNTVCCNNSPVLLHSTCLVHRGGSGGGLICSVTGKLTGIVVNHVKDEAENISYPDINFSIPAFIFMPCIFKYLVKDSSESVFNVLNCYDQEVVRIWNLEPSDSMQIKSKL